MRVRSLLLVALLGCAEASEPDELDSALLDELSTQQGSASGTSFSGSYMSSFTTASCDCPKVEVQAALIDVCMLAAQSDALLELTEVDGFLVVASPGAMLTGAIEAEGSFVVAGRQDLSSLLGPIQVLGRMDGSLEIVGGQARLNASVGQRLLGEFGGDAVDCRWLGAVEAIRID